MALGLGGFVLNDLHPASTERIQMIGFDCETYVDSQKVELLKWYTEEQVIEASRSKKAADKPDIQDAVDRCARTLTTDYGARRSAEIRKDVLGTLSGWLIPPLLVLVLGYAVAWIIRGFRRKPI